MRLEIWSQSEIRDGFPIHKQLRIHNRKYIIMTAYGHFQYLEIKLNKLLEISTITIQR